MISVTFLYRFPFKEEMPAELTVLLSTGGFIYLFILKSWDIKTFED